MNTTTKTTMENLQLATTTYGAVIRYGDKVLVTDLKWVNGDQDNDARIYRLSEQPIDGWGEDSRCFDECELTLEASAENLFQDAGHAIAWCIANA